MPSNGESELEAAIWSAMTAHKVSVKDALPFVAAIMRAALHYGAGDSDALTAERRAVLHRDTAPAGQPPASDGGGASRAAPELSPPGSAASSAAGGGATMSTGRSIPDAVTSGNARLSTCA